MQALFKYLVLRQYCLGSKDWVGANLFTTDNKFFLGIFYGLF